MNTLLTGSFTTPAAGNSAQVLKLPFIPDEFEIWVQGDSSGSVWTGNGTPGSVKWARWDKSMVPGTALCQANTAGAATVTNTFLATGGITPVQSKANLFGPSVAGTGVTNANPAVMTLTPANAYLTGSVVVLQQTTGAFQLAGIPWYLTSTGANTYTLGNSFDASAFGAAATNVVAKEVLFPYAFTPYVSYIVKLTLGSTTTVQTSMPHGLVAGGVARLLVPEVWGSSQISGQYGTILSVADQFTFTIAIDSSAATAFTFPTSVQAGNSVTPAQVIPFGDPAGSFDLAAIDNNFQGLIIGNSATAGSAILSANNAKCSWRAQLGSKVYTSLTN